MRDDPGESERWPEGDARLDAAAGDPGEYDRDIEAARAAPRTYPGGRLGLPIAGPGSLGSYADRFWGLTIDGLVILPFSLAVRWMTAATTIEPRVVRGQVEAVTVSTGRPAVAGLLVLVPAAIYVIVAIAVFGRTLGQRSMNLEVRTPAGDAPGWTIAVVRWVLVGMCAVIGLIMSTPGLAAVLQIVVLGWMFVDRNRQGLHDKLAGVVVVRSEKRDHEHR